MRAYDFYRQKVLEFGIRSIAMFRSCSTFTWRQCAPAIAGVRQVSPRADHTVTGGKHRGSHYQLRSFFPFRVTPAPVRVQLPHGPPRTEHSFCRPAFEGISQPVFTGKPFVEIESAIDDDRGDTKTSLWAKLIFYSAASVIGMSIYFKYLRYRWVQDACSTQMPKECDSEIRELYLREIEMLQETILRGDTQIIAVGGCSPLLAQTLVATSCITTLESLREEQCYDVVEAQESAANLRLLLQRILREEIAQCFGVNNEWLGGNATEARDPISIISLNLKGGLNSTVVESFAGALNSLGVSSAITWIMKAIQIEDKDMGKGWFRDKCRRLHNGALHFFRDTLTVGIGALTPEGNFSASVLCAQIKDLCQCASKNGTPVIVEVVGLHRLNLKEENERDRLCQILVELATTARRCRHVTVVLTGYPESDEWKLIQENIGARRITVAPFVACGTETSGLPPSKMHKDWEQPGKWEEALQELCVEGNGEMVARDHRLKLWKEGQNYRSTIRDDFCSLLRTGDTGLVVAELLQDTWENMPSPASRDQTLKEIRNKGYIYTNGKVRPIKMVRQAWVETKKHVKNQCQKGWISPEDKQIVFCAAGVLTGIAGTLLLS